MRHNQTCPRYIHEVAVQCTCRKAPRKPKFARQMGSDPGGVAICLILSTLVLAYCYWYSQTADARMGLDRPAVERIMK